MGCKFDKLHNIRQKHGVRIGVENKDEENAIAFSEKNYEIFLKINNEYTSQTKIYSDCYVEKGKY